MLLFSTTTAYLQFKKRFTIKQVSGRFLRERLARVWENCHLTLSNPIKEEILLPLKSQITFLLQPSAGLINQPPTARPVAKSPKAPRVTYQSWKNGVPCRDIAGEEFLQTNFY